MGLRFTSPARSERTTAVLGVAAGVLFGVCMLTGLLSHLIQHPPGWFTWPSRPVWLYRWSQGLHVFCGIAAIPALLAKLWSVYPNLYRWPPVRGVVHAIERLWIVPLVGGALLLLATGLMNIGYWYGWGFDFIKTHYWTAWIVTGALVVHLAAKLPVLRRALARGSAPVDAVDGLERRRFLVTTGVAAGVLLLVTAGSAVTPLRRLAVLSPRRQGVGPQGLPVNKDAASAGVGGELTDPDWRLAVEGRVIRPARLSLAELRVRMAGPMGHAARLPIACVEGWSQEASWRGVRLRDLLEEAGAPVDAPVRVQSLQRGGYSTALLNPAHARDPDTLLALELNGEPLHPDHGYPARLIAPNNPGVMQTKWLESVAVL
jgi:DMSO/TMAO reductase YedYZ molybdopterin-dependent catalytic subunit